MSIAVNCSMFSPYAPYVTFLGCFLSYRLGIQHSYSVRIYEFVQALHGTKNQEIQTDLYISISIHLACPLTE